MRHFIFALCLITSTAAWALGASSPSADSSEGTTPNTEQFFQAIFFERIVDGDTFVGSGRKIRLWGINAPEKKDPNYMAATWYLESLLKEGALTCKFIENDRYQRDVMHCLSGKSDIGSLLVQMGLAKDYTRYSGGYYQTEQAQAQAAQRGIWKHSVESAPVACTMEAKECPDGSYVSRQGPNCEFAACP